MSTAGYIILFIVGLMGMFIVHEIILNARIEKILKDKDRDE